MRLKYLILVFLMSIFWNSTLSAQDTLQIPSAGGPKYVIVYGKAKIIKDSHYSVHGLVDVGYNFVEQTYGNFGVIGTYNHKKNWWFEMGICMTTAPVKQFNFKSLRLSSGYYWNKQNLRLKLHYLWNPSTYYENHIHHLVLDLGFNPNYIDLGLGFHYRHLHFFKQNPWNNMFNLVYKLELSARPKTSLWNIKAAVKNMDYFDYTRWSQPMFSVKVLGRYTPKSLEYYLEFLAKPSGVLNMVVNGFDYKVRAGIIWVI